MPRKTSGFQGMTLVEILIVTTMVGFVSAAIYTFFQHYTSSYVKIDDKLESAAEGWQVLRMLKDDLLASECPNGDPLQWHETLKSSGEKGFEIVRRWDDQIGTVQYLFDGPKGDLTRNELFPGKGPRSNALLRNRCKEFQITLVTDPATIAKGGIPQTTYFQVHLELSNVGKPKESSAPLIIDTNVVPIFLNQRLNHRYVHEGLPSK